MNKKIALIVGTNLHWAPFYYRYEKYLINNGINFDLIIWNREGIDEISQAQNIIEYKIKDVANNKNPKKIWKFFTFGRFVKRIIKKNKYDKLIFVGTYGCAIAFCCNYLSRNYKNKMWIDVRDDLYEWFKPFYLAEKKSIDASFVTTISSPAFTKFLPPHNYYLMHNIDPNANQMARDFKKIKDPEERVRISFIGNVRYYEQNIKLLNLLKNDKRFKIQYFGKGSDELKQYCFKEKINNVEFHGAFKQEDTIKFYEETDIINNMYGNETMNLQLALSNKLYYGIFLELPILVSNCTFMKKITYEYNMGIVFEDNKEFPNKLYKWYSEIQQKKIIPNYKGLKEKILNEEIETMKKLNNFLGVNN